MNLHDSVGSFAQTVDDEVVMHGAVPRTFKEERCGTDEVGCLGVLPLVAHDVAAFEIELPLKSGFLEQSGLRLSAWASIHVVMSTQIDVVETQLAF